MAQLRVRLKKSLIGQTWRNRRVVDSLGLRKVNQSRVVPDNDSIRGMVKKVPHLLEAETVEETPALAGAAPAVETVGTEI